MNGDGGRKIFRLAAALIGFRRVSGSGFGVQGLGFRVQGSGFRVQGLECILRVSDIVLSAFQPCDPSNPILRSKAFQPYAPSPRANR